MSGSSTPRSPSRPGSANAERPNSAGRHGAEDYYLMDLCYLPAKNGSACNGHPGKGARGCSRHLADFANNYGELCSVTTRLKKVSAPFPYIYEEVCAETKQKYDLMSDIWRKCYLVASAKPIDAESNLAMLQHDFSTIYNNLLALKFPLTASEEEYFARLQRKEAELKAEQFIQQQAIAVADEVYQRELEVRRQQALENLRRVERQEREVRKLKEANDWEDVADKIGAVLKMDNTPPASQEDDFPALPAPAGARRG